MKYKTIFVSDIHLGTNSSQSNKFLEFIKNNECETLFLCGDIIDFQSMKTFMQWNQIHNTVIQKILRLSRKNVKIIYIPGNHDEIVKQFADESFGSIEIHNQYIHTTINNKKLLVIHGDQFDGVLREMTWLYTLGSVGYTLSLSLNFLTNWFFKLIKKEHLSISQILKKRVKNIIKFMGNFEKLIEHEAIKQNVDGIICGHIHQSSLKIINGKIYANCGCWLNDGQCTAIIEDLDGNINLITI